MEWAGDVLTVAKAMKTSCVVFGGSSYGGFLASRAASVLPEAAGCVVLSGFISMADLRASEHRQVRQFVETVMTGSLPLSGPPDVPSFVAHGSSDERIPIGAIERYADRLASGSVFLKLEGEGHAIRSDEAACDTYSGCLIGSSPCSSNDGAPEVMGPATCQTGVVQVKRLNVIDEHTREALAIRVEHSIGADVVVGVLDASQPPTVRLGAARAVLDSALRSGEAEEIENRLRELEATLLGLPRLARRSHSLSRAID